LYASCLSEDRQSALYSVIHDNVPTNKRLVTVDLVDAESCRQCERPDTLLHLLTERVHGTDIGNGHGAEWQ